MIFSQAQLEQLVSNYVDKTLVAQDTFKPTYNDTTNAVNRIGKTIFINNDVSEKLTWVNGDYLGLGKIVEELSLDLALPDDFDREGTNTLKYTPPTFRPAFYSYTQAKKTLRTSYAFDEYEKSAQSRADFEYVTTQILGRNMKSLRKFENQHKRQLVGLATSLAITAQTTTTAFTASTAYKIGTYLKDPASDTRGVVFRTIPASGGPTSWADAVAKAYIVPINVAEVLEAPTDTTTSDAFIKRVKQLAEIASDDNQGYCLSGQYGGSDVRNLRLVVLQGVKPNIEVESLAGAFHTDKLALPVISIDSVPNFGLPNDNGAWAILVDERAIKAFPNYFATRINDNGEGDFINYFTHAQYTDFISMNAFIHVFYTGSPLKAYKASTANIKAVQEEGTLEAVTKQGK